MLLVGRPHPLRHGQDLLSQQRIETADERGEERVDDVRVLLDDVDVANSRFETRKLDLNAETSDEGLGHLRHGGAGDPRQLYGGLLAEQSQAGDEELDGLALLRRDRLTEVGRHPQGGEQAVRRLRFDGQRLEHLPEGERPARTHVQLERQFSEIGGGGHLLYGGAERHDVADEFKALGSVARRPDRRGPVVRVLGAGMPRLRCSRQLLECHTDTLPRAPRGPRNWQSGKSS